MHSKIDTERGANVVEFALVAPFLILLLFGIIEFAWVFGQDLSVKHGAREGARLAAVDFGDSTAIANEICGRMDLVGGIDVTFATDMTKVGSPTVLDVGDEVTVTVNATANGLTGFMDSFLPTDLESTVAIRIEQESPQWTTGLNTVTCP
jgi:Flp pilus assembly protein TadG